MLSPLIFINPFCIAFQSTRPVKDETSYSLGLSLTTTISIHSSRKGQDHLFVVFPKGLPNISIHSSYKGR
ncbi:hypothetical protein, partial [Melissococcus plutonius]|uniref:hypothetical protein n=1 Tax=Melissococcus plutonius TaxID=33970 RepID=UPI003EE5D24F